MTDLAVLVRQLQGALAGRRLVIGHSTSAGAVDLGEGVTVVRLAAGDWRLTFDPPFQRVAAVVAMQGQGGVSGLAVMKQSFVESATTSTYRLAAYNTAGSAQIDTDFWFVAAG